MREILFRAKRIDNGEWVEGDLRQDRDLETAYISGWDYYTTEGGLEREPFEYEIKLETLCQYTGLKDKNGKRIWENDILRQKTTDEFKKYNPMQWERYGVVKFGENDWRSDWAGYCSIGFYIEHLRSISIRPKDYCVGSMQNGINQRDMLDKNYPFEVIGNIFDNPELLKEQ